MSAQTTRARSARAASVRKSVHQWSGPRSERLTTDEWAQEGALDAAAPAGGLDLDERGVRGRARMLLHDERGVAAALHAQMRTPENALAQRRAGRAHAIECFADVRR